MPRMNAPGFYSGPSQLSSVAQGKQSQQAVEVVYEDDAFERAFDAASKQMMEQESAAKEQQEKDKSQYELVQEQVVRSKLLQREKISAHHREQENAASQHTEDGLLYRESASSETMQQDEPRVGAKSRAVVDYEMQLKLLEQANIARLRKVREENEKGDLQTYEQFMERSAAAGLHHAVADYRWQAQFGASDKRRLPQDGRDKLNSTDVLRDQQPIDQQEHTNRDFQTTDQANELSRTAGQLLDNLKDEKSEKFQQSNFMQLMRQLRDKEMIVEGENIVPVSSL